MEIWEAALWIEKNQLKKRKDSSLNPELYKMRTQWENFKANHWSNYHLHFHFLLCITQIFCLKKIKFIIALGAF